MNIVAPVRGARRDGRMPQALPALASGTACRAPTEEEAAAVARKARFVTIRNWIRHLFSLTWLIF
jgi:hypothetical protein